MGGTTSTVLSNKLGNYVNNVDSISQLHDNDIVIIEPNGKISIVYDINSKHNAIFITEMCNSNCVMCPQPPVKHEDEKFDLNIKYISLIDKNAKSIGITGGEPTLIGDKLFDILTAIHKRIPHVAINLLSNGIKFADYAYASRFANAIKQDLVVDIPLYSDIDTIHNSIVRTNSFFKTIKGIYNLAKFNVKIGIRVVIHRMNYERLPELSEFIYSNFPFVYHVAFMQMEPMGYAKDNLKDLWIDPLDYNNQLEKAVLNLYYRDIHVAIYNTQLCILPEKLRQFAVQSISDWKNIYIDECNDCIQKEKCPGFFESSMDIHSRRIKAFKKEVKRLNPPSEFNEDIYYQNVSKKLSEFLPYFDEVKHLDIVDAPCGYGRNMFLFTSKEFNVVGIDTDSSALRYIEELISKKEFQNNKIKLINSDILNEWVFTESSLGGIINVQFYSEKLINKFKKSLKLGGYLYIETPKFNGSNYINLPEVNELKFALVEQFEFIFYEEKTHGNGNKVSVIFFGKKIRDIL